MHSFVSPDYPMFETSVRSFLPQRVTIPFRQADGTEYQCGCKPGDVVREGQVISAPKDISSSEGAAVHSSVPGKVVSVSRRMLCDGRLGLAAEIATDGVFSYLGKKIPEADWSFASPLSILEEFRLKGVVNTFGRIPSSLSAQIHGRSLLKNRIVAVRMFDEDPSRYTDSFVAQKRSSDVIQGALIIAKALYAHGIAFVVPRRSEFSLDGSLFKDLPHCLVQADTSRYPSGFSRNLVRLIASHARTAGESVFMHVSQKSLFIDPQTALSAYEAVVQGIPAVERYVHVTGSCLKSSGMFKVRIGASIRDLAEQCGGFKTRPSKVIVNGKLTGNAVPGIDIPVTKQVKSVEFVPASQLCSQSEMPCIRCGRCRTVCPEGLAPDLLYKCAVRQQCMPRNLCATAALCSRCSLCNSVCPSRLPLSQSISLLYKE